MKKDTDIKHSKHKKFKKILHSNLIDKYKNNIKKAWNVIKEIIGKYKFKTKKLPHRIASDEKEFIDEKTIAEKIQSCFPKYTCQIHILSNLLRMKVQILKVRNFAMKS